MNFLNNVIHIRELQSEIFKTTADFVTNVIVNNLNKFTVSKIKGTLKLRNSKCIQITNQEYGEPYEMRIRIYKAVLQGVESAYSPNVGGPFKKSDPVVSETINFYRLVARGQMALKNRTDVGELFFSAELKDVTADVMFDFNRGKPKVRVTGWRALDFFIYDLSPIEPERDTANAMLNGYLSQEVPFALEQYLTDNLLAILKDQLNTTSDPCDDKNRINPLEEGFDYPPEDPGSGPDSGTAEYDASITDPASGPDPGTAEYDASNPDPAGGPDPGTAEYDGAYSFNKPGPPDPASGPDPGTPEFDASNSNLPDPASGPDPGTVESGASNPDPASGPDPGTVESGAASRYIVPGPPDPASGPDPGTPEFDASNSNLPDPASGPDPGTPEFGASNPDPAGGPDPGSAEAGRRSFRKKIKNRDDHKNNKKLKNNKKIASKRKLKHFAHIKKKRN